MKAATTRKITYNVFLLSIFFFIFSHSASAAGSEMTRTFFDAIKAYEAGNYPEAIDGFQTIAETGVRNGKLYYNLGNAYLKNNDLGHALLWYERAMKLRPKDPDLKFNHQYALSLTQDEKEEKTPPLYRVLFFWKHMFGAETVRYLAVSFNLLLWMLLAVRTIRRKRRINLPAIIIAVFTVVFTLTGFYDYYQSRHVVHGVVLPDQISVRSGFTEGSTELFKLHAGSKVKIEKKHKDFFKVRFSEGKIGWIPKNDIGVI